MQRTRRLRRLIVVLMAALLVLVLAAMGGVGWYSSSLLRTSALQVTHDAPAYDFAVTALSEGQVTLARTTTGGRPMWQKEGIWGLAWDGGYGRVGAILSQNDDTVVRAFEPVRGSLAVGEAVRLDGFAYEGDPREALGLDFTDVTYESELGEYPAWFIPGEGSTWAIFTHGWRADRQETLRMLPTVVELGIPSLVITYRNDEGTPGNPDGFYRFGATEWRDVEAAVQYAMASGASDVVLVGYSMGGAASINFLYSSPEAEHVRAAILDAPLLSFWATVVHEAAQIDVTGLPVTLGRIVAARRFGIDWDGQAYMDRADELDVPILHFHGDDDERSPVWDADAFAESRPDIVTYVRVPGATHVRAWNMDPAAYAEHVRAFLVRTGAARRTVVPAG